MTQLKTKSGRDIVGTLEILQGCAKIESAERLADGSLQLVYDGTTDIWWDTQRTQREDEDTAIPGDRMFVDAEGWLYPESEVVLEDES